MSGIGIQKRGSGIAKVIGERTPFRGGGIALRGMGVALAKGGSSNKQKLFGGKESYSEELGEAKAVASKKISPKQFVKGEKSEKHKGEELKSLAKEGKSIASGKMSPEQYAKMETSEPMKKGGRAFKKVDSKKNPGLSKLPTSVRNKMGFMKKGGKARGKK
jgi:hypothetical protein